MVEYRLYYDENGKVICYTCDNLPGNYILVDALTFSQTNHNLRVIDGQIHNMNEFTVISKLIESDDGIGCEVDDICVLTTNVPNKKWKVEINEYRNN